MELRSQRDQIMNVVNLVREIGFDLFKAEKLAENINYRRLLNIVMLYLIMFLLFFSIILVVWFRIRHRHAPGHFHWLKEFFKHLLPSFGSSSSHAPAQKH